MFQVLYWTVPLWQQQSLLTLQRLTFSLKVKYLLTRQQSHWQLLLSLLKLTTGGQTWTSSVLFIQKTHPLGRCRSFRAKTLEESKTFLKEGGICFKCCSSTDYMAKDCKIGILCKECGSNIHVMVLHPGPAPWNATSSESEQGGEGKKEDSTDISKCTEVCSDANISGSCSKICLMDSQKDQLKSTRY